MTKSIKAAAASIVLLAAVAVSAHADRATDGQERAAIEAALREQGFVSWSEIELDDCVWEVDNDRMQNGPMFDL